MAESDYIKEVVNQAALQVAIAVMLALRDEEAGPKPTSTLSDKAPQNTGTVGQY